MLRYSFGWVLILFSFKIRVWGNGPCQFASLGEWEEVGGRVVLVTGGWGPTAAAQGSGWVSWRSIGFLNGRCGFKFFPPVAVIHCLLS